MVRGCMAAMGRVRGSTGSRGSELEQSAEQADILHLVNVSDRYCTIASDAQIDIPFSFLSRRNAVKEKLVDHLESIYKCTALHDQPRHEPHTVFFHPNSVILQH